MIFVRCRSTLQTAVESERGDLSSLPIIKGIPCPKCCSCSWTTASRWECNLNSPLPSSSPVPADQAPAAPSYTLWQLVRYMLALGTWGFGGPVALVGYMYRDLVEKRRWISEGDYKEGLALAQLMPGPLGRTTRHLPRIRPLPHLGAPRWWAWPSCCRRSSWWWHWARPTPTMAASAGCRRCSTAWVQR